MKANIIQYVECKQQTGINDWPDCVSACIKPSPSCPVVKRIQEDKESGEYGKVDRYTIWPD